MMPSSRTRRVHRDRRVVDRRPVRGGGLGLRDHRPAQRRRGHRDIPFTVFMYSLRRFARPPHARPTPHRRALPSRLRRHRRGAAVASPCAARGAGRDGCRCVGRRSAGRRACAARLRRAALRQQLQLPAWRVARRGAGRARRAAGLFGAGDHGRVLGRRGGAGASGREDARAAADRRHRGHARRRSGRRGPRRGRTARPAPRAARHRPRELRTPRAADLHRPPAGRQGHLPPDDGRPRRRAAGLSGAVGAARGAGRCRCAAAVDGRVARVALRGARVDRGRSAPRRSRCQPARDARRVVAGVRPAVRGGQRRPHAHARAPGAAGRAHGHAAAHDGRACRARAVSQRRAASALACAARAAVSAGVAGRVGRDRAALHVHARRAALRVPGRDRADRHHAGGVAAHAGRGRAGVALRRRRPAVGALRRRRARARRGRRITARVGGGRCARADRARARADRRAALRGLLPDRLRHRPLRAHGRHPVPGPRVGGQLGRVLRARHHRGRPGAHVDAVRALHLEGAQRAARHRRRLRASAARGGDPVHLREVRARPRRARRDGHLLPAAWCVSRRRPCAGSGHDAARAHRREPRAARRRHGAAAAAARSRPRPRQPCDAARARAGVHSSWCRSRTRRCPIAPSSSGTRTISTPSG